jgi:hypothetical protein
MHSQFPYPKYREYITYLYLVPIYALIVGYKAACTRSQPPGALARNSQEDPTISPANGVPPDPQLVYEKWPAKICTSEEFQVPFHLQLGEVVGWCWMDFSHYKEYLHHMVMEKEYLHLEKE